MGYDLPASHGVACRLPCGDGGAGSRVSQTALETRAAPRRSKPRCTGIAPLRRCSHTSPIMAVPPEYRTAQAAADRRRLRWFFGRHPRPVAVADALCLSGDLMPVNPLAGGCPYDLPPQSLLRDRAYQLRQYVVAQQKALSGRRPVRRVGRRREVPAPINRLPPTTRSASVVFTSVRVLRRLHALDRRLREAHREAHVAEYPSRPRGDFREMHESW